MNKTLLKINLTLQVIAVCLFQLSGAITAGNGKNKPPLDSGDYTPLKPTYDHDPEAGAAAEPQFRVQAPGANGFLYPSGRITNSNDADDSNFAIQRNNAVDDDLAFQPQFMTQPNVQDWKRVALPRIPTFDPHSVHRFPVENVPTGGFHRFQVNDGPNYNMDRFPSGGGQSFSWNSGYQRESYTGPDGITRHRTINW